MWFETAGAGCPVVFLHPGFGDSRIWDPQWQTYSESFRTVRCDMRGFGRSPIVSLPVTYARDIAALLDAQRITGAACVGSSLGGRVALELALARPDLVRALVLSGAAMPEMVAEAPEMAAYGTALMDALGRGDLDAAVEVSVRTWLDGPYRSPDRLEASVREKAAVMQRDAFRQTRDYAGRWAEEPLVNGLVDRLSEVAVPTLVLVGEIDMEFVRAQADILAAGIPSARRVSLEGAAHAPHLERPTAFDAVVLPFLRAALAA
jgi:3-oxoadipate enol-lactonase